MLMRNEIRKYISEGKFDYLDINGDTLLHKSCRCGDKESVKLLLEKNFDVNQVNFLKESPLHVAVTREYTAIAKLLLLREADVNLQAINKRTPLHLSIKNEMIEASEWLVSFGAEADYKDKIGDTALHVAYGRANKRLAELLLDANANFNLLNGLNKTILDMAFDSRIWEMRMLTVLFALIRKRMNRTIHPRILHEIETVNVHVRVKDLINGYEKDLDEMQNTFVIPDITCFNLLTMPHRSLAILLHNHRIKEYIENVIRTHRFPAFTTLMICHYKRAFRIYHYHQKLEESLQPLLPPIPIECTRRIIQMFTERDLIILGDRFDLNNYIRSIMFKDMFVRDYVNLYDGLLGRKGRKSL